MKSRLLSLITTVMKNSGDIRSESAKERSSDVEGEAEAGTATEATVTEVIATKVTAI